MRVVYTLIDGCSEHRFAQRDPGLAPPAYRDRLRGMGSDAARARTTAGLWLLAGVLGSDAAIAGIGFSSTGRPMIEAGPSFSISHSGALVACAVSDRATIGLDVEASTRQAPLRLARRLGMNSTQLADDPAPFFAAWCAREATVKASGRVGLARIHQIELSGGHAVLDARRWWLTPLAIAPGYAGCIASDRPLAPIVCEAVSPSADDVL